MNFCAWQCASLHGRVLSAVLFIVSPRFAESAVRGWIGRVRVDRSFRKRDNARGGKPGVGGVRWNERGSWQYSVDTECKKGTSLETRSYDFSCFPISRARPRVFDYFFETKDYFSPLPSYDASQITEEPETDPKDNPFRFLPIDTGIRSFLLLPAREVNRGW